MKNARYCLKCHSGDILRIAGPVRKGSGDNSIRLGWIINNNIPITRYLCADCGYSEEWIDQPEHLKALKEKYGAAC